MDWLKRYFAAPVFEDEDKTRTARLLNAIMLGILALAALSAIAAPFIYTNPLPLWLSDIIALLFWLGTAWLARRGQVRLASFIFLSALWLIVVYIMLVYGGLDASAQGTYIVLTFAAGLLLGARAGVGFAAASFLFILLVFALEANKLLPSSLLPPSVITTWIGIATNLVWGTLLLYLALHSINHAIARARRSEHDLTQINCQLKAEIAERAQAEQKLRDSEEYFRALIEHASDLITVTNPDGSIRYESPAIHRLFGYEPGELVGKTALEYIHPEDADKATQALAHAMSSASVQHMEMRFRHKDGSYRVLEGMAHNLLDNPTVAGIVTNSRDITHRKQAEEQLRLLSTAIEQSSEGIAISDLGGYLLFTNSAFAAAHGYTPEELFGKHLSIFHTPEQLPVMQAAKKQTQTTGQFSGELWHVRRDGVVFPTHMHNSLLRDEQGQPVGMISTLCDITEQKLAESQREAALKSLQESEKRYRALAEAAHDMIFIIDRQGYVRYANSFAAKQFEHKPEAMIGQPTRQLFPPEVAERQAGNMQKVLDTGQPVYVEAKTTFPEHELWLGTWLAPIQDKTGQVTAVLGVSRDITHHKLAEVALQESEEKYRTVVETSVDAIFLETLEGQILDCNTAACKMYGYTKDELLGLTVADLVPKDIAATLPDVIEKELQNGSLFTEARYKRKDGRIGPCEVSIQLITLGQDHRVIVFIRDITERKLAEDAMRSSQQFLQNIFEAIQDGISVLDTDLRILSVNPTMQRWYAHAVPLEGKLCYHAYHGRSEPCEICPSRRAIEQGTPQMDIVSLTGPEGRRGWLELHAFPLQGPAGHTSGVVEYVRDITQRQQAEDGLRQYAAELETRNEQLDAFARTVAHDLKGPLGYMIGFADVLEQDYATLPFEEARRHLRTIARSGRKMNSIINELLLLAETFKIDVEFQSLDMESVVLEAVHRLSGMIDEYQAELVIPDFWPTAKSYGPWVEEVWVNYISNALKYGGKPPRIELGATPLPGPPPPAGGKEGGVVRFWVRDNGAGIPMEKQAQLFTPFTRIDQIYSKGHGLGLSIVSHIVQRLGGQVGVESQEGNGSLFWFTLPA